MNWIKRNKIKVGAFIIILLIFFLIPIPKPLFDSSYSTVLEDQKGNLLSARIADDGQWRFPESDTITDKFNICIRYFEDEYFYYHPGFNPVSMFRAARQNWKADKIVSGGSTLTMQLVRLARNNQDRTFTQKLIELFWALRTEFRYSKDEILTMYAAHAPFGGNVVGIEAASWRYYNRPPHQLSWGEMATLAVLPNAPSLIYPGKNHQLLLEKRNRLLQKLTDNDVIDSTTAYLAMQESLPEKPHQLPQTAQHLMNRAISDGKNGKRIQTTINNRIQNSINEIVKRNYNYLKKNEIYNLAVLVIDNKKNQVISYVGNTDGNGADHGHKVDVIMANRSTGSLLKPFLYGLAWQDGIILPHTLLADIPTNFASYSPKNFDKTYDGACAADQALIRSLNIPAVRLLQEYGVDRFYDQLTKFPMKNINRGSSYYGLSIILGGAESSLWEMCTAYKGLSESLRNLDQRNYQYDTYDYSYPNFDSNSKNKSVKEIQSPAIKGAATWQLVESLSQLTRPGLEKSWENYATSKKIAWKTGTSFGFRDAWSIGICPEYTIGVWVGNADGEGRPGLTGINVAAPILFQVFQKLGKTSWYNKPLDELYTIETCHQSGYRKGLNCIDIDTIYASKNGIKSSLCPYHQSVQLNKEETLRVNSNCYEVANMVTKSYLVLPPLMEWFYKQKEPSYQTLPPFMKNCNEESIQMMELISPESTESILIPVELNGTKGRLAVEVAHRLNDAILFWHLDDDFIGATKEIHQMELAPEIGKHQLTLVDQFGNRLLTKFEVVGR